MPHLSENAGRNCLLLSRCFLHLTVPIVLRAFSLWDYCRDGPAGMQRESDRGSHGAGSGSGAESDGTRPRQTPGHGFSSFAWPEDHRVETQNLAALQLDAATRSRRLPPGCYFGQARGKLSMREAAATCIHGPTSSLLCDFCPAEETPGGTSNLVTSIIACIRACLQRNSRRRLFAGVRQDCGRAGPAVQGATPKRSLSVSSGRWNVSARARTNKFVRGTRINCHFLVVHSFSHAGRRSPKDIGARTESIRAPGAS